MRISLITYTYNDHAFAADLLRHLRSFGIPFHEILVVDDASAEPFPPQEGVRVLRLPENVGPGQAKRAGINAASGDVVLSLDADIRLSAPWLRHALQRLADAAVGVVGATILPALADNYLSRALHKIAERYAEDRDVSFLPGAVWLLRKQVWDALGGLEDFSRSTHEDVWFSRKVYQAGLTLVAADSHPVYEKRRLHRIPYCRRQVRYLAQPTAGAIAARGLGDALGHLRLKLDRCLEYAARSGEAGILYVECIRVSALLAAAAAELGTKSPLGTPQAVVAGAGYFLRDCPELSALFAADCAALGLPAPVPSAPCPPLEAFFAPLRHNGLLETLETVWAARFHEEDATPEKFDSHYLD